MKEAEKINILMLAELGKHFLDGSVENISAEDLYGSIFNTGSNNKYTVWSSELCLKHLDEVISKFKKEVA